MNVSGLDLAAVSRFIRTLVDARDRGAVSAFLMHHCAVESAAPPA